MACQASVARHLLDRNQIRQHHLHALDTWESHSVPAEIPSKQETRGSVGKINTMHGFASNLVDAHRRQCIDPSPRVRPLVLRMADHVTSRTSVGDECTEMPVIESLAWFRSNSSS